MGFHLDGILRVIKVREVERRPVVARGCSEGGTGSHCFMGRVSVLQNEKDLRSVVKQCLCT